MLALAHFLARFLLFFLYMEDSFTPTFLSVLTLAIHVLLHATSFQFDLPNRRLESKPMIWNEFRAHNMIFAYRHICATLLGIWLPDFWWKHPGILSIALKVGLLCAVCKIADVATEKLGNEEKRTTNAMPYPTKTAENVEQMAKWFYAKSQFAATSLAAFGPPFLAFGPILAIEAASFLMTLVRKGIIDSVHYHSIYTFTLFIMGPAMLVAMHFPDPLVKEAVFRAMCACYISVELRMNYGFNKYLAWILAVLGAAMLQPLVSMVLSLELAAWIGTVITLGDTFYTMWKARENERMYGLMKSRKEAAHTNGHSKEGITNGHDKEQVATNE